MTVRELLSDETKWCKGAPREGKDERCLLLAVYECYPSDEQFEVFCKISATGLLPKGVLFTGWNDAPERTFADIRRVIEAAGI